MSCSKKFNAETLNKYFHDNDSFASQLQIDITHISEQRAVATMPLSPLHRNGLGHAHGGAIYSLVDMAFAAAAHASGDFFVTAQSSISYLEPGKIGPLRAEASTVRCGKTLGIFDVRVYDSDDTLIAVATMTGYNTHVSIDALVNQNADALKA